MPYQFNESSYATAKVVCNWLQLLHELCVTEFSFKALTVCTCPFLPLKVEHKRIELLKHPLVTELLNHKWNKIAMPSILFQLITYLVFLGFLTSHILLLPNPKDDVCATNSKNQTMKGDVSATNTTMKSN